MVYLWYINNGILLLIPLNKVTEEAVQAPFIKLNLLLSPTSPLSCFFASLNNFDCDPLLRVFFLFFLLTDNR